MTYALLLAFFRNDMGFGGNNGLTDFKDILGFNVQAAATRAGAVRGQRADAGARRVRHLGASSSSKYGKLLIAVRDAESRTRFLGWRAENVKLFAFTVSAVMAGIAGALYVPQVGIINPGEFEPGKLDRGGHLDGGRRPRHASSGRSSARCSSTPARSWFTGALPEFWLFALGGLFVAVTLFLPKGIVGTVGPVAQLAQRRAAPARRRERSADAGQRSSAAAPKPGDWTPPTAAEPQPAE